MYSTSASGWHGSLVASVMQILREREEKEQEMMMTDVRAQLLKISDDDSHPAA
jgi:hypothetical protein